MPNNNVRKLFASNSGFTLIELLVVVAILGVLAAVAVPNVVNFLNEGTDETANMEVASVHKSIAAWQSANQTSNIPDSWSSNPEDVAAALNPYIYNGLKGTYKVTESDGVIILEGINPPSPGLEWKPDTQRWE